MKIITDIEEARFLLNHNIISFDIETYTAAPHKDWGSSYGLSYCTDITWISFYVKGEPAVVFKLRGIDNNLYQQRINFIKEVLSRENITIIAHNAVFDLRSVGGHLNFIIPPSSSVWDTMTIANLLLMGVKSNRIFSLEALLTEYNLLNYHKDLVIDEQETSETVFIADMKKNRAILHLLDTTESEQILFYVALDSITTYRLYELQRAIIETQEQPEISPRIVWSKENSENGRGWEIIKEVYRSKGKHNFSSTKNWKSLGELIAWEQRISRWSANAAIRGVKFNKEWSEQHIHQLMQEYGLYLEQVKQSSENYLTANELIEVSDIAYYEHVYDATINGNKVRPYPYFPLLTGSCKTEPIYLKNDYFNIEGNPDEIKQASNVYLTRPLDTPIPCIDEMITAIDENGNEIQIPALKLQIYQPSLDLWFEEKYKNVEYGWYYAKIAADWYRNYLLGKDVETFDKMVNKTKFKPFYVFCVAQSPLPSNDDFVSDSYLLSGDLKSFAEDGGDADFLTMAMHSNKFSMGDDSLEFYHKALWELSGEDIDFEDYEHPVLNPFIEVLGHKAKFNRIKEFWRHAERDGRVHSLLSRKTNTGRLASSQMNLQNIKMKVYRGYLIADDSDHILIGVDVSNAENYFAAMTFGDSALARACVYGDFHETMARAYWGDDYITKLKETNLDAFDRVRSRGKSITFGGAYGAGYRKIARMVGCSQDEAKELLYNRDMTFPDYARGKNLVSQRAEACYKDGFRPAFTTLWTGRRVAVPYLAYKKKIMNPDGTITEKWQEGLTSYKAINYLQQGGVGELILRAQVLAEEEFERRGWTNSHIPLQVHDEIIAHVHKDHALEAAHIIANIIFNVVPEEFRKRTTPAIRFLANLGQENAKKWGYNPLVEYPLPLDKFANAWGIWDLPEGVGKTPNWISDLSLQEEEKVQEQFDEPVVVELKEVDKWSNLQYLHTKLLKSLTTQESHFTPVKLNLNGEERGPFKFDAKMNLLQHLHHNGYDPSNIYWKFWEDMESTVKTAKELIIWWDEYGQESKNE